MTATYAVFLRGSSNTYNAVDNCVWVGEATDESEAKRKAQDDEGVSVYNGQYLEAGEPHEFGDDDQDLIAEWQPAPKAW
jgi:hypothetical protein